MSPCSGDTVDRFVGDVRVGIVSWQTADLLDRCLHALPAALGGLDAEVAVVDNASSDGSADVAVSHSGVTVIRNRVNRGYAAAMNQALAGSRAPILVALNPDTVPPPGSLSTLVKRLQARPDVALVVPRLVNMDGTLQHSVYRFPSIPLAAVVCFVPPRLQRGPIGRRWWLEGAAPHDRSGPIDWAIGAVHAIRAGALQGAPPYSERWFMYVEDIELCWRMHRAGWQVRLEADVAIPHVGNASGRQAWGSTREQRFWAASYDFDAVARGRVHAHAWAAINALGSATHLLLNGVGRRLPGRRRAHRRAVVAQLRPLVALHARAALVGPPSLEGSPPADA